MGVPDDLGRRTPAPQAPPRARVADLADKTAFNAETEAL